MTTQRPDYKRHPIIKSMVQMNEVNEKVIDKLLLSLSLLDQLEGLAVIFKHELDGSYIEEMQDNCKRLLNAALNEREAMSKYKGVNTNV
jgi:hypothetical protein